MQEINTNWPPHIECQSDSSSSGLIAKLIETVISYLDSQYF